MDDRQGGRLVGQEEAEALIAAIGDTTTRELLGAFFASIWRNAQSDRRPINDVDLVFITHVATDFCSNHKLLQAILSGQKDEWGK